MRYEIYQGADKDIIQARSPKVSIPSSLRNIIALCGPTPFRYSIGLANISVEVLFMKEYKFNSITAFAGPLHLVEKRIWLYIDPSFSRMKYYIKLLRPKDWAKNLFLIVPSFFAGQFFVPSRIPNIYGRIYCILFFCFRNLYNQ